MKTAFVFIDHGLGLVYFLDTGLAKILTEKGIRLVFLVQDEILSKMREKYGENKNLFFDSNHERDIKKYQNERLPTLQYLMEHIRDSSASNKIPLTYVETHRLRKEKESKGKWRFLLILSRPAIWLLRRSKFSRTVFRWLQQSLFTSDIFSELFEQYQPDLVISITAGWRIDKFLLREAKRHGVKTAATIVGWDNPSAMGIQGADVTYANVWSEIHKTELVNGIDWKPEKIHIGGMPIYDGYINKIWEKPWNEYFQEHGLDENKSLVAYVATALSISPNLHIIKSLVEIIHQGKLDKPAQLLIRLHPNHFKPFPHYQQECAEIYKLAEQFPEIKIVAPKALAGDVPRYSGEDFPEKSSMLRHSDVIVSIYSTMVVEAALHDKPVISVCIDSEEGWGDKYWIPLSTVPNWPTASRIVKMNVGKNAFSVDELIQWLNLYLNNPGLQKEDRLKFVESEITYLRGESTRKTAEFFISLLEN